MNCKPGDVARYVGSDERCYGHIVLCVEIDPLCELVTGEPGWVVSPPMPRDDGIGDVRSVRDRVLRPINKPGEDAQDETLDWLPVPTKETEAA